jgi:hypothetical protein
MALTEQAARNYSQLVINTCSQGRDFAVGCYQLVETAVALGLAVRQGDGTLASGAEALPTTNGVENEDALAIVRLADDFQRFYRNASVIPRDRGQDVARVRAKA